MRFKNQLTMIKIVFSAFFMFFALSPQAMAEYGEGPGVPGSLDFCGETVPLNKPEVYEAVDQELVLLVGARSRVWLTLRQDDRITSLVDEALRASGLPADIKYVPMAMSNLTPNYSSGDGRGIWRFSKARAASLGLKVDKDVDERLDPFKATEVAAQKLKQLKNVYGNWTLATAALIGNETEINAVVAETGLKNYYQLPLSDNTERALAWVLAAKALYANPGAYGYKNSGGSWPRYTRSVAGGATDIVALANQLKVSPKALKDANPHILGLTVPAGANIYQPK